MKNNNPNISNSCTHTYNPAALPTNPTNYWDQFAQKNPHLPTLPTNLSKIKTNLHKNQTKIKTTNKSNQEHIGINLHTHTPKPNSFLPTHRKKHPHKIKPKK